MNSGRKSSLDDKPQRHQKIFFKGPFEEVSKTPVDLINLTNQHLAFKFKTNLGKRLRIEPGALGKTDAKDIKLMIQSAFVSEQDAKLPLEHVWGRLVKEDIVNIKLEVLLESDDEPVSGDRVKILFDEDLLEAAEGQKSVAPQPKVLLDWFSNQPSDLLLQLFYLLLFVFLLGVITGVSISNRRVTYKLKPE